MPKKPVDYSRTIIYKFVCKDLSVNNVYVGSTTDFVKRKCMHKFCSINENNKSYNTKVYKMIRENGGWNNWEIVEIEKYPCNDKREAETKEREWYEILNADMNTIRPRMTDENIKEKNNKAQKVWREKNIEKIKKQREEKYTCKCGKTLTKMKKARHERTKKHIEYIEENNID